MGIIADIKELFKKVPSASIKFAEDIVKKLAELGGWEPAEEERYRKYVGFFLEGPNVSVWANSDGTVTAKWIENPFEEIDPKSWRYIKGLLGHTRRSIDFSKLGKISPISNCEVSPTNIATDFFEIWRTWQKSKEGIIARVKQLKKDSEVLEWAAMQDIRRIIDDAHKRD